MGTRKPTSKPSAEAPRRKSSPAPAKKYHDPIAVIGVGCRFPGNAFGPQEFWRILSNGVDAITEIPPDRWNIRMFYDPEPGIPSKTCSRWGGFVNGIDLFDAGFFGISPREAGLMDPQQRMLLEVAYEAIEDAGLVLSQLAGSRTGVYVGVSVNEYGQLQSSIDDRSTIDTHTSTGNAVSIVANRVSYCFDLRGPSMSVDTACSSALVAVHLACQSIWHGESNVALAAGVNATIAPEPYIGFSRLSMLSTDGRCKAFDERGNGFVRAEGIGVAVLKPFSHALADGDEVYALIRSTVVNQDGKTNGIAVPNPHAQSVMLQEACRQAGISPRRISYVEAHGTGTAVGDPIETSALGEALAPGREPGEECFIGSVKTNIGHLEAAAGIAGLIKTVLALKHGVIPPNLHFQKPNPLIDFERLKLRVPTQLERWPRPKGERYAGVNSFGFGGTNAHVLLSDVPEESTRCTPPSPTQNRPHLLPFSARSPEALRALAGLYHDRLVSANGIELPSMDDLCHSLAFRRSHFEHRLSIVARTKEELAERLAKFIAGQADSAVLTGHATSASHPKLAFVFSGQGPQWWAMGRQLYEKEPHFRQAIEECDTITRSFSPLSLVEELTADEENSRLHETSVAQPCLVAIQVGLCALWKSWGVVPDAVAGHSTGEIAAAYCAGILSLEDAMRVIYHRGRSMERESSRGRMLAATLTESEAGSLLTEFGNQVTLAAVNSPSSVTFSGNAEPLARLQHMLEERQVYCKPLRVNYAFHGLHMDPVRDDLLGSLKGMRPRRTSRFMVSSVTGRPIDGSSFDAEHVWRNVREPVRFSDAVFTLIDEGFRVFVEVGPHPTLSGYILECLSLRKHDGLVVPSLRRDQDEQIHMLSSAGSLHAHGCPITFEALSPRGKFVKLPPYPWQHQPYWHESESVRISRLGLQAHPLLGRRLAAPEPSWSVEFQRASHTYLYDHRIHGHPVFPAAGYIEMALAAAREVLGTGTTVLEDVEFPKALFLPEGGEGITVQTTLHSEDSTFSIASKRGNSSGQWTVHARGSIRVEADDNGKKTRGIENLRARCPEAVRVEDTYNTFSNKGIQFGPLFRGIRQVYRGKEEALGFVTVPGAIIEDMDGYLLHPTLLDPCLQVSLEAQVRKSDRERLDTYLPVSIARVRFVHQPATSVVAHVRVGSSTSRSVDYDLDIMDASGTLIAAFSNLNSKSVDMRGKDADDPNDWIYEFTWEGQTSKRRARRYRAVDYLPTASEFRRHLSKASAQIQEVGGWRERREAIATDVNTLCTAYIVRAFEELGWDHRPGSQLSHEMIQHKWNITPKYSRLIDHYLGFLVEDRVLEKGESGWTVLDHPSWNTEAMSAMRSRIVKQFPAFYPELMLLDACGRRLADVLRGSVDPLHLLFPDGSPTLVHRFYYNSTSLRHSNLMVAEVVAIVAARLPEGRPIRILEIGAGTGSWTSYILPHLPADRSTYVFSDISPLFVQQAVQRFHDYAFLEFATLDIEKDVTAQGFDTHGYDIVVASDVVHATANIRHTLGQIRKLLAPGGLLLLNEPENPPRWVSLVFALTDGWWNFSDKDLRISSPLLPQPAWTTLLAEQGFVQPDAFSETTHPSKAHQTVYLARASLDAVPTPESTADVGKQAESPCCSSWLILADRSGIGQYLTRELTRNGEIPICVFPGPSFKQINEKQYEVSPDTPEDFDRLLHTIGGPALRVPEGIVHCWTLDAATTENLCHSDLEQAESLGCHSVMHFLQAWSRLQGSPTMQMFLITRNAQPAGERRGPLSLAQSPLIGLGRVIANEHPQYHCRMIDLDQSYEAEDNEDLLDEICFPDEENEVALRGGRRYVLRVVRSSLDRCREKRSRLRTVPTDPVRLEVSTPGMLENLVFRDTQRRAPGPGEVEIRVAAASLNFRDVLKTTGIYPSDTPEWLMLGDECAGVVSAVGSGVTHVRVGDEVIAVAPGSFGSCVLANAEHVVKMPMHLRPEEAATIPIAFLTAYYALHHLARIGAGDKVLIHAATGGVGLAALQIARLVGAEIYATAGSAEKREFLKAIGVDHVMNSRTLSFASEIREVTNGRGVDIVLNSLAGEAIHKGLQCLAPYGRFLEIGKRDIYRNNRLAMRVFKNNISFSAIDLAKVMTEKPVLVRGLLDELMQLFGTRNLHPLPHSVFPLAHARHAFRVMSQALHIGKIVLSFLPQTLETAARDDQSLRFSPQATYLITGGLGGFGMGVARWMVRQGAKHVVLMSRKGVATQEARDGVAALEAGGARVHVATADVSKDEDVTRVLEEIRTSMPPLRGVMHAAMVLEDGILVHLTSERFKAVMSPKVQGAWNLHRQTAGLPLEHFVLFSSVATLIGNPGQPNYTAANTFLDALAHYRRSRGLPALTVNWGHIADAGYVARNAKVADHLDSIGLTGITVEQATRVLEQLLLHRSVQAAVAKVNWRLWSHTAPPSPGPRFSLLITNSKEGTEAASSTLRIQDALLGSTPEERRTIIHRFIAAQLARVLGTSEEKIPSDQPLIELGMDSLMTIELKNRIEKDTGLSLPTVTLMRGPSIEVLTETLLEQLSLTGGAASSAEPSEPITPVAQQERGPAEGALPKIADLSETEVDAMLSTLADERTLSELRHKKNKRRHDE